MSSADQAVPVKLRRAFPMALAFHVVLAIVCLIALLVSVLTGPADITLSQAFSVLWDQLRPADQASSQPWQSIIITQVRMPRALVGFLVGGGLGICGAVMQGLFRNPMADPGIVGVSGGASLGAVVAIATGLSSLSQLWVPALAFVGAVGCVFFVYFLSTQRGRTSVSTLLLSGIAVSTVAVAMSTFLLSQALPSWDVGRAMISWLMGTLDGKTWWHVRVAAPLILLGSVFLCFYARDLNVLTLGEEIAQTMGVSVSAVRRNMLIVASLVAAAAVAVSGTIAFIGLVIPHILRLLIGPDHLKLLPASFLGGAGLLVFADIVARTAFGNTELQIGVLTSLIGGPFFVYLLIMHRNRVEQL